MHLAARGGTPASHRGRRGAPLTRRDDRAYREYLREEQRSQRGCIAGRMQLEFHHGLLGARLTDDSSIPSTRTSAPSWLLHFLPRRHETTKKALGYILRAFFVSS